MSNISFDDLMVMYDGTEHEVLINGELPEGVSVSYVNNKLTNPGSIEAEAIFTHNNPNYNEIPSMKATLIIDIMYMVSIIYDSEKGTASGGGEYHEGDTIYLKADPNDSVEFLGWYIDGKLVEDFVDYIFKMGSKDIAVEALFVEVDQTGNYIIDGVKYYKKDDLTLAVRGYTSQLGENVKIVDHIGKMKVTELYGAAFTNAKGLVSITIPEGVTKIGNRAFYGASSLTNLYLPSSIESLGYTAFSGCSMLENVYLNGTIMDWFEIALDGDTSNPMYYGSHLFVYSNDTYEEVTSIMIPEGVTAIDDYRLMNITGLVGISIPTTVTSIGQYAFKGCSSLSDIYLPNSITNIGNYAFHDCTNLRMINLPSSLEQLGGSVFDGCTSLKSVDFNASLESIPYNCFYGCTSLEDITIPSSVTTIEAYAFYWCESLSKITIPYSVNSIERYAFAECISLESVLIPSSVNILAAAAFRNCINLTSVEIEGSITELSNQTFEGCTSLTTITLPSSITSVGASAFSYCTSLDNVYFNGTIEQWQMIDFSQANSNPMNFASHLYVLDENGSYYEVIS